MKLCSVSGCSGIHYGRGFCRKHYMRDRTHGDTSVDARSQRTPIADRFWAKVAKSDGCWEWTGCKDAKGYGEIGTGGKNGVSFAHRVSYELNNGPITGGLHVLHRCDNPSCVRPDHLFLGTHADNMRDMWNKGRGRCDGAGKQGSGNKKHKLIEEQVVEIRKMALAGIAHGKIAERFGVTRPAISYAVRGTTWKHVGGAL